MSHPQVDRDWWRGAVIYQIYPRSFQDSSGDGIGDLAGIRRRLPYVASLGVDAIWISPFFTSPMKDFGYDVSDYCGVDPMFGSLEDFDDLVAEAHRLDLKVMIDLVISHTSDEHPWFQAARADPNSPYRDWYVWRDEKPDNITDGIVFPGVQKAIWSYDRTAKAWYMHRFYKFQPDLNTTNPAVRQEILKIMGFWLALGVSGFRVDAVPFLIEPRGVLTETPAILAFVAQSFPASKLAPLDDPFAFAELQAFNSYLCSTVHVAHAHGRRGSRWVDDADAIAAMQKKVPETMAACFELIENGMLRGPWVMGETYSVADPYLFTIAGWLEGDGVDIARFPHVRDHRKRMMERPAVARAMAAVAAPA